MTRSRKRASPKRSPFQRARSLRLPPGEYYIGDPSYFVQWSVYEDFLDKYSGSKAAHFKSKEGSMIVGGTGMDGNFVASNGAKYSVDAGLLGIASFGLGAGTYKNKVSLAKRYGSYHDFSSPVIVHYTGSTSGNSFPKFTFTSGSWKLSIDTKDE